MCENRLGYDPNLIRSHCTKGLLKFHGEAQPGTRQREKKKLFHSLLFAANSNKATQTAGRTLWKGQGLRLHDV